MLKKTFCLLALTVVASIVSADAVPRYVVSGNQNASHPYDTWKTAAANIQDAVAAANLNNAGDEVIISNGHYTLTGEIRITNCIVRSVGNDPTQVTVDGGYPAIEERCFYLNHSDAVLSGVTITNGYAANDSGGGVYVADGTVTNCVIANNCAVPPDSGDSGGGGIYILKGLVTTCLISNNTVSASAAYYSGGGGIFMRHAVVSNCVIVDNKSENSGSGGGILLYRPTSKGVITDSLITGNEANTTTALQGGGGIYYYWQSKDNNLGLVERCAIINNKSLGCDGGGVLFFRNGLIRNCLILNNWAYNNAGGLTSENGSVQNCTIINNSAGSRGGGISLITTAGNVSVSNVSNCIIYYNNANISRDKDCYPYSGEHVYTSVCYSCTPQHDLLTIDGIVTDPPEFINQALGDYRLATGSVCINKGLIDADWMLAPEALDLDRHSRVDHFSSKVDMGCYEYLPAGIMFRIQ